MSLEKFIIPLVYVIKKRIIHFHHKKCSIHYLLKAKSSSIDANNKTSMQIERSKKFASMTIFFQIIFCKANMDDPYCWTSHGINFYQKDVLGMFVGL
jgi:hypothetical protein